MIRNWIEKNSHFCILWIIFIGCTAIYVSRLFLSWDAAVHLHTIGHSRKFYTLAHEYSFTRISIVFFQAPVVLVLLLTNDFFILSYFYGIVYSYVPFISAIGVFHILKKEKNSLFFVAISGICLAALFIQFHPLCKHLIACQIFWILLSYIINYKGKKINLWFFFIFAVFLFFLHPVSSFLLVLLSFFLFAIFWTKKSHQRQLFSSSIICFLLGLTRFLIAIPELRQELGVPPIKGLFKFIIHGYEIRLAEQTSSNFQLFFYPPRDFALTYIILICCAAFFFLMKKNIFSILLHRLFLVAASIMIIIWIFCSPVSLLYGLDLRFCICFISLPFYLAFFIYAFKFDGLPKENISNSQNFKKLQNHSWIGVFSAFIFCVVMMIEGILFNVHLAGVKKEIYRIDKKHITTSEIFKEYPSFLNHWSFPALFYVTEGHNKPDIVITYSEKNAK